MKVGIDQLQSAINKILKEYGDDVYNRTEELTKAFAKKGAQAVKSAASSAVGGHKYAKGWTSEIEVGRLSVKGTIYNKTPGLPHLLEHGHARRGGGRAVEGRPHIAPVEEKLVEEFTKAVEGAV